MIRYSLICEDKAHYLFLRGYLDIKSEEKKVGLRFNGKFFRRNKCRNASEVYKLFPIAAKQGIVDDEWDVLFVGYDYDDRDRGAFEKELKKLEKLLDRKVRKYVIIFFPVQAIEHWLLIMKEKIDKPKLRKQIGITIQNIPRRAAKKQLYGTDKASDKKTEKILNPIIEKLDLNWMTKQSESFRIFNEKVDQFLENV